MIEIILSACLGILFIDLLLKVVYLLFRPSFLKKEDFGKPPSRGMLMILYSVMMLLLALGAAMHLGFLQLTITTSASQSYDLNFSWAIIPVVLIIDLAIVLFIRRKKSPKKPQQL
jgi:hypothetical protein